MKLEEIFEEWNKDGVINVSELGNEAADVPTLHSRWLRRYVDERLLMTRLKQRLAALRLQKHEWLLGGETRESRAAGWTYPARGAPLRADVNMHIEADPQVQELQLRLSMQEEKVKALEEIVRQINWRHSLIKLAQEDLKWKQGL